LNWPRNGWPTPLKQSKLLLQSNLDFSIEALRGFIHLDLS